MTSFWEDFKAEVLRDPAAAQAHADAKAKLGRAVEGLCTEGQCVEWRDPVTAEYLGGWGEVGCPCQEYA